MKIGKTYFAKNRKDWRNWLAKNHNKEKEIWFIFYKKSSGKSSISYNDAVEEAICYGWIDSIVKSIDNEKYAQRFSPRKPGSNLSEMNKIRIKKLKAAGKMTKAGLDALSQSKKEINFKASSETLHTIQKNKDAWNYFQKLPKEYKQIRIAYIESRKHHSRDMYEKSLAHFVKMTAKNKRIGFVKEMP